MLLSAFSAHLRVRNADRLARAIAEDRVPLIMDARDARTHVAGTVRTLEAYLQPGTPDFGVPRFRSESEDEMRKVDISTGLMQLEAKRMVMGAQEQQVTELLTGVAQIKLLMGQLRDLDLRADAETMVAKDTAILAEIVLHERSISRIVDDLTDVERHKLEQDSELLHKANEMTLVTLWLATRLGAGFGIAFSILLGRHITRAVDRVASRANSIAEGDLTGDALKLDRSDQVGILARAMDRMQASLGGIIGTVADTAGSLTGSAAFMREASDHIHRRMDQQSQQTQQAATAMQEMSASIAEVSRYTQSAAETARSAAQTARDGGTIVKQMLASMSQIATSVSDTGTTVGMLGEESKRISQIVTVIDEIARKTNLLALNAAIEAARAGDQGRGFAVVAGEVRRLAESTAEATGEIGAMITGIQERTRSAISSMEQGTSTVREGMVTTTQAGEALERIIGMAERVDRMITQIAIAAAQQATAADQSSASLDSIHSLSNANVNEMATTAAGIEVLRGTAVALERQVDRFMVQTTHGGPRRIPAERAHV
jgi:methyl-accepting chemotaxis protein